MSESPLTIITSLPTEIQVNLLTYLRAYDLANVQQTCRAFASRTLTRKVVQHTATQVYTQELTNGWETTYSPTRTASFDPNNDADAAAPHLYTFEALRHIEWLVVARVLSRPEPVKGGFYVSKSWCRTALKWLEVQEAERERQQQLRPSSSSNSSKRSKKKLSKKQQRMRSRRLSDASPPWPNVNSDLVCEHENLQHAPSTRTARARRRLLDRQAWKTLKKLYPESVALPSLDGECLQCKLEKETAKRAADKAASAAKEERKLCLSDSLVRALYTRSRGVPTQALLSNQKDSSQGSSIMTTIPSSSCPLQPGLYHVLPRSWLHQWRRYIKTGEGGPVPPPDASLLLCDAHRIPLLPPHLESWLHGETFHLFDTKKQQQHSLSVAQPDMATMNALRGAGLSNVELEAQVQAMALVQQQQQQQQRRIRRSSSHHCVDNEQLDRENQVVVEILTDDEYMALEKWWPSHSKFSLKFQISQDDYGRSEVIWSTCPCRACDASSKSSLYSPKRSSLSCRNNNNRNHPTTPSSFKSPSFKNSRHLEF